MTEKILRVGHSPDADDAFMFYGFAQEAAKVPGYRIEHVVEDIQSLNRRALKGELEVTAISAAVYPFVADRYRILSSGSSIGRKYGPIVVAPRKKTLQDFKGLRIAVPGRQTTAFLLLKIFLGDFIPVDVHFDQVISAVRDGLADAALVIHEGQLNFSDEKMEKCADLGECWFERHGLPIPLGLDTVRRDLGAPAAEAVQKALSESIRYAFQNEHLALEYAAQFGRGVEGDTLREFVNMYVNDDTLRLKPDGEKALQLLFQEGFKIGMFPSTPPIDLVS
jgi:1,4-dihydroxy-6-naphthoate synthase